MKDKVMSEKTAKALVVVSAIFLLLVGFGLYKLFEYQGINKDTTSRKIVNYDIKDYVETVPVVFNGYSNVYSKINVSRVTLKDLDNDVIKNFMDEEDKLIEYITTYYNEINNEVENYIPSNEVSSSINMSCEPRMLIRKDDDVYFTELPINYHGTKMRWSIFYLYDELNDLEKERFASRTITIPVTVDSVVRLYTNKVRKKKK